MGSEEEMRRWEVHRKLITYLYTHHGLAHTMELMANGPQFDASKREYVYRLGVLWGVRRTPSPKTGIVKWATPPPEELYLCLSERAAAWNEYWKMVTLLGDREQDLGLLFRCARAVDTRDQALQLHERIERSLRGSDGEDREGSYAFLRILQGYVLHQVGEDEEKVKAAAHEGVSLLARNDVPSSHPRPLKPYRIDVPALSLVSYAMRLCGADPVTAGRKVLDVLLTQLPPPGSEVEVESAVGKLLDWSVGALEAPFVLHSLSTILETPCGDIAGAGEYRARVCVFSFLVSQFLDCCSGTHKPFFGVFIPHRMWHPLRISVYDILFTLTVMMLRQSPATFEHNDASPSDIISLAREGGRLLPQKSHLLVFFLDAYALWTYPTPHSAEKRVFMRDMFARAWKVIHPAKDTPDLDDGNPLGVSRDEASNVSLGAEVDDPVMPVHSWFENSVAGHPQDVTSVSLSRDSTGLSARDSHITAGSIESVQERIFDLPDRMSTIDTMTAATTLPTTKGTMSTSQEPGMKLAEQGMAMAVDSTRTPTDYPDTPSEVGGDVGEYESDTDTIYSSVSQESDKEHSYIHSFLNRFSNDCPGVVPKPGDCCFDPDYLEKALKEFASRLHAESTNPFQWGAAVTLHKTRRETVEQVLQQAADTSSSDLLSVEAESGGGDMRREPFFKSLDMTSDWLSGVEVPPEMDLYAGEDSREIDDAHRLTVQEDAALPQLSAYEEFICTSEAYAWLLSKMQQSKKLNCGSPHSVSEIGTRILSQLRRRESLRRMSRRRPTAIVTMTFELEWDPVGVLPRETSEHCHTLKNVLCLTGTLNEAQATTALEYMTQTWPDSCCPIMTLIPNLSLIRVEALPASLLERNPRFICERDFASSPSVPSLSLVELTQSPRDILLHAPAGRASASRKRWESRHNGLHGILPPLLPLRTTHGRKNIGIRGTCWSAYFRYAVLVHGYPVLSRPCRNTGLEVSLATMAFLTKSSRMVCVDGRIMMKGFSSLAIATLAITGVVVWHLVVSDGRKKRISYIDPRLDDLEHKTPGDISLRSVESSRHIIGWCGNAVDLCGHSSAKLNVKPSGLGHLPACTTIDRLYVEAGGPVVAGFNMCLNKKQQPVRLTRARDYPSLLNWVKNKVINFYDVSSRRAWLVDGASALLHLLRIWLEVNQSDPESAYTWVFDPSMLRDSWEGCTTARQAALKTLKLPENLDLGLYVIEGDEHAKLRTRAKDILLDLELMIDRQEKGSSPDGINIPQSFDFRKRVTGFDVFDVIAPERAVQARVQPLGTWREGWSDLVSELGVLTIFGSGFGGVIRPSEDCAMCPHWQSLPRGQDYMAASVPTLQNLHQQCLARLGFKLGAGEFTKRMAWYSDWEPLSPPMCAYPEVCDSNPVQLLSSRSSWSQGLAPPHPKPVDVMRLDGRGAVIFGHRSLLGQGRAKRESCAGSALVSGGEQSAEGSASTSNAGAGSSVGRSGGQSTEESPPTSDASGQQSRLSLLGWELWEKRRKQPWERRKLPAGRRRPVRPGV